MSAPRYDWNPYKLPDRLQKAIGIAIAAASQTENIMAVAIMGCLGTEGDYGMAVTAHMPVPLKFSVLKCVAEIRIDDLDALDELDVLLARIEAAIAKRNALAHDGFATVEGVGLVRTSHTARTRLEVEIVPITVEQIEADALEIYHAGLDLMGFLSKNNLLAPIPPVRARS